MGIEEFKAIPELGLSKNTYRNWIEIPDRIVFWLFWREAERDLALVRAVALEPGTWERWYGKSCELERELSRLRGEPYKFRNRVNSVPERFERNLGRGI